MRQRLDAEWSRLILARDRYCRRCGQLAHHAHHIITKGSHTEMRHDERNGVALCTLCHDWAHHNPSLARNLFSA